ncbi:MAG: tetratricopeptide repeat protein, partial [Nitrospinaceae bacterium]|nr:tetratricopeptide repeat protein [Nitrospinaceae bacterium]NIR57185.1 tetratricopeptide repeat protein [Nitrospinaceae bacterium]NIS87627.1 tetratricopeptide repeat protein [Nitrospinaceae bacterium]NIT84495.1 tetratricopeptide repeat protein [Nitrospinaceae bacterium]NIU46684.1 tetratricopeptide repeat protein [Nitrospinaceae bacterium]
YGVEKNAGQAVAWFHKAAEQGNVESFYRLGIAYANGNGVTKNDAEATQWIKKAAAKDHREAQILLGWMYHQGLGVSKDYDQALFWLEKVSDENNLLIQISLGVLYFWKRNLELSEKHLRKALAISPKNTNVHANLGFLMFDRQRFDEALKFFDQALKSGSNADTLAGKAITLAALNRAEEALKNYRDAVTLDPRYMDCQKLINENFWSEPACQTARPIIQQIQETATQESSEEN